MQDSARQLHVVGEAPTAATLYRDYSRYVAAIAKRLLGHDDDVDDVIQDVFLAAHRGLDQLHEPGAVKGWLAAITVRTARYKLKKRRLRNFLPFTGAPDYTQIATRDASPEERVLVGQIYERLDTLPTDERLAWSLRYLEGEKLEDVAELCNVSLATAKRRIAAAQAIMEKEIR